MVDTDAVTAAAQAAKDVAGGKKKAVALVAVTCPVPFSDDCPNGNKTFAIGAELKDVPQGTLEAMLRRGQATVETAAAPKRTTRSKPPTESAAKK